jgi:DNA-binding CsgD family transcriptional regulator
LLLATIYLLLRALAMQGSFATTSRGGFVGSLALVGRSREQFVLREELTAAVRGHGRLVVIGGEAGIGKSALARDLAQTAADQGFLVLTGHCYDLTATPPYGPWLDLVAEYPRSEGLPPPPAALESGHIEEIASQAALFADVRAWFGALASARPVLLVLEDLHWSDHASIELLRHLGARLTGLPFLLLATYRLDELTRSHPFYQQLPALVRDTECQRIELRPLETADLHALVAARWPLSDADRDRLVAYLQSHAEGNPFFVMELTRTLEDASVLRRRHGTWILGGLDRVVMPSLVRQIIDGRVARLGDRTRQPLALASVIGQEVALDLWARVADLSDDALMAIVEQAIDARLLDATPDGTRVRFVHALTREALYEGVVAPKRRLWHQQVGEALLTQPPVNPDAVAAHFQRAGDPRAWEWFVQAGERAQRAYAWLTAVERFAAAAALLEGVPGEESRRGRLLYRCGRLLRYSDTEAGIVYLTTAERVAVLAGDRVLAADAKYSRGLLHCYADAFGIGLDEMESGIRELEALPWDDARSSWDKAIWMADALPPLELAHRAGVPVMDTAAEALIGAGVHHRRGGLPWFLAAAGRYREAEAMARTFIALVDGVPASGLVISAVGHAHFGLGITEAALGRPEQSRPALARAREIYRLLDHHAVIGFTLLTELRDVVLPYFTTLIAERRRLASEAEAALELAAGAFPSDRSARRARLGLLFLEGEWDEAERIASEVEAHGNYLLRREVTNALAPIWYHQGRVERVRDAIRSLLPQGPAAEPGSVVLADGLLLQRLAVDLALDRGDFSAALAWLEANDRWLTWSGALRGRAENQISWARYCQLAGDLGRADHHADVALHAASEPRQPLALLAAHRQRGELAQATGDMAAAERHLGEALGLAEACAAPFECALTLLAHADLCLARHRLDEARVDLTAARAALLPLWAQPALLRADGLEARLAAAVAPDAPAGLSPREVEVLRLVAQGLTDADVGDRLSISPRTVSQHMRSIYNKLDLSSRVAATRFAIDHGLA